MRQLFWQIPSVLFRILRSVVERLSNPANLYSDNKKACKPFVIGLHASDLFRNILSATVLSLASGALSLHSSQRTWRYITLYC